LNLLNLLGIGKSKLKLVRLPRGDGDAFVNQVESFIGEV
jgi:hypothetical protein